tara:strand:+ start:294386 stop:294823 length:438 start_codon:yes stop_codon:yes gene_type:complete
MKLLWDSARTNQLLVMDDYRHLASSKSWLNEWCTIKVGCSRRSGHDYAIANMARDFQHPMFLSMNLQQAAIVEKEVDRYAPDVGARFFSVNNLRSAYGISDVDAVFVNTCSFLSESKLDSIREFAMVFAGLRREENEPFGLFLVQ